MKAIVIASLTTAGASLPPMDGDGIHLTYLVDGVRTGGYTLVGNVPGPPPISTCFVLVHTSEATLDAMIASEQYLFVDHIPEPDALLAALAGTPHQLWGRAAVVQWLRNHGYSPALLNAKIPPGAPAHGVRRGLQDLHQVTELEYARAFQ